MAFISQNSCFLTYILWCVLFCCFLIGSIEPLDGGEAEEEKEQDIAYQNWFSNTYESGIEQVSLQFRNTRIYVMNFKKELYDAMY